MSTFAGLPASCFCQPLGCLDKFVLCEFLFPQPFKYASPTLFEFCWQFSFRQLAVRIGVQTLKQFRGIRAGPRKGLSGEFFERQFRFSGAIEYRLDPVTKLFWDFIQSHLAIFVAIQHFKSLASISASLLARRTIQRNIGAFVRLIGLLELVSRQFAIVILVTSADQSFKEPRLVLGNLGRSQFAVTVLVELLKQRTHIGRGILSVREDISTYERGERC